MPLFSVTMQKALKQFRAVSDQAFKEVGLRLGQSAGDLEIEEATVPVAGWLKVLFQFVRNLLAEELAYGQSPV